MIDMALTGTRKLRLRSWRPPMTSGAATSWRAFLMASAYWFASMALAVIGWGWLAVEKGWVR